MPSPSNKMNTDAKLGHRGASAWTVIVPLLAGIIAYVVFTEIAETGTASTGWWEEVLEAAPALMAGLFFEVFVLLPLRALFVWARIRSSLLLLGLSAVAWLAISLVILWMTNARSHVDPWADATIIVPGLVLAAAFTLMSRNALRR